MITITYYGHSCFKVEDETYSVVFDPYQEGSVPGFELQEGITANKVMCSHGHGDHNAKERITVIPANDPAISTVEVDHDDCNGEKRGKNLIGVVDFNGTTVVHMGDIGRMPSHEEYEELKKADIMMIPCGGFYTIDAQQAKEIVDIVQPKLTVLMHYRRNDLGYDVLASLDDVVRTFTDCKIIDSNTYTYDPENSACIALTF